MLKGLNTPHLLLASPNPMRMIQNLNHLLAQQELAKLFAELDRNVVDLFKLGMSHYNFAVSLPNSERRQKISRLYLGQLDADWPATDTRRTDAKSGS